MIKTTPLPLFFIIATIPFLTGTNQPFFNGFYLFLTLLAAGIWLVFFHDELLLRKVTFNPILVLIIFSCMTLTTLDLPMQIIRAFSPVRAENLTQALQAGQITTLKNSLSYYIPGSQLYTVYGLTLFLLFYYATSLLQTVRNRKIILWIISLVGVLEAVIGILQALFPEAPFLEFPGGSSAGNALTGTFTDNSLYASFLNMCWPISLVLGLSLCREIIEKIEVLKIKNKKLTAADWIKLFFHRALLPLWCTALIILSVILSGSTAGIVTMFILVLLCRIVIPYPRIVKIIFSGIIYAAILLYGLFLGVQGIISQTVDNLHSVQDTFVLWSKTLALLREHLYTGIGIGAFPYMAPVYSQVQTGYLSLQNVQNDYVVLAVELGLPVILLLGAWLAAGMISYGRSIYRMPRKIDKMTRDEIIIIGSYFALTGFLLSVIANNTTHSPVLTFYAVSMVALLDSAVISKDDHVAYQPEYLFSQKKPVRFIPYRKPIRKPRR